MSLILIIHISAIPLSGLYIYHTFVTFTSARNNLCELLRPIISARDIPYRGMPFVLVFFNLCKWRLRRFKENNGKLQTVWTMSETWDGIQHFPCTRFERWTSRTLVVVNGKGKFVNYMMSSSNSPFPFL